MYLLTAENIDYVIDVPEPEKPNDDATPEERKDAMVEYEAWAKDNKRARIFMLGSMIDSLAAEHDSEQIARKILGKLEKDFGDVSLVKVLNLVNRFLSFKMNEGSSVNEHINKLSVLAEELKVVGYPFQEEVQVMVVLNSLLNSWEQFKMSFCHSERALNMRNLRHHLVMEEDRKLSQGKERNSNNSELHLGEERNDANKKNWQKRKPKADLREKLNRKRDRDDRVNYDSSQRNDKNKRDFTCHNCGQYGHFRADCRKKKKYNEKKKQENQHDDSKANPSEGGMHYIFVCTESLFTTTFPNSWVVDSGSTSHIARDHKSFTSMQTIPRGNRYVYLGTNARADILGIGNYVLKLPNGGKPEGHFIFT